MSERVDIERFDPERPWLVWAVDAGLYWRPKCAGYTGAVDEAGRFSEADANRITAHPQHRRGSRRHPDEPSDIKILDPRAAAELEALREIVGRLPKTADGVPVTPDMELFRRDGYARKAFLFYVADIGQHRAFAFENWYSTAAAAADRARGEE